ncbi:MAG TPA: acyl-CoA dehydrogenase family protein [Acidimicrobiales bacterium]|nr:acyl-CoA dehydrogenase family protein [Acidimicrobiales bacterium]
MDQTELPAPPSPEGRIEAVAGNIASLAGGLAGETERLRRLPDELVGRLREGGLLNAGAPREVGGLELAPEMALRCAEEIARADASVGWCVSIAITSSLLAAYLPEEARTELFGDGQVAAGVWAPRGKARPVDGGVVVSGRWAFCSGITHADLLFAGCLVQDEATDQPAPSVVAIPKRDVDVLDTWYTLGLRGTGSHDAVADGVFVPSTRVFSLFDGPLIDRPLYRFPPFGFFALSVAVPALGNARAAIDELMALATDKVGLGSSRTLAERASTQAAVAAAEASHRAARGFFYQAVDAAWRAAEADEPVPLALRNDLRLAATHAARTSAAIVSSMYDLAGGSAIYDGASLQRRFRDAHTATAHFQVNETSRELPGRILLALPADATTL